MQKIAQPAFRARRGAAWVAAVLAAGLLVYLVAVLLRPEDFS